MSARALARRAIGDAVARWRHLPTAGRILLYHDVATAGAASYAVPPSLFAEHLEWIAQASLSCSSVREWRAEPGRPTVALTLDDGLGSAYAAADLIRARGWKATFFVVPAWLERGERRCLSWSEVAGLEADGFEIGAHAWDHERPCGRSPEALRSSFERARVTLEDRLGVGIVGLAYPEGLAPRAAREAALRAGFAYACTSEPGRNVAGTDPHRLRRNEIVATDDSRDRLLGKLEGSDDWMGPVRRLENALRCR